MTIVKFLFSGLLKTNDQYIHKHILIYSQLYKRHKNMTSGKSSDDLIVIDTLPSPVLIDIDKPPTYKLSKGLFGSGKISFKIGRKHNSTESRFHPADAFSKYVNNSHLINSNSAFRTNSAPAEANNPLKRNIKELSSPIIIDIEEPEESKLTLRNENIKEEKINLPADFFTVDQSSVTDNYFKKGAYSNNANQNDPVLIDLGISDQDEAGTSTSTSIKALRNRSVLNKNLDANSLKKLKRKTKKKLRRKLKKKTGSSLKKLKSKSKKKLRKSTQTDSNEKHSVQTDSDESGIIPVCEVTKSACRGFLLLDVAKDIPLFSNDLEKSKIYVQKRNFISGRPACGKRSSKEYGSDTTSSFDSCRELDSDHSSAEDEIKCNYKPEAKRKETKSKNIKKTETGLNDIASSSSASLPMLEDSERFGYNVTEKSIQNEKNNNATKNQNEENNKAANVPSSNENSDHESEEYINYDNISMETDIESEEDVIDIENVNTDYIPLSSIKINDLEYCPPISDEILNKRKNLETLRRWELTGLGNEMIHMNKKQNGSLFTLLSYNVLSQQLIFDNIHLYKNCDKKYLEWSYRWPLLQQEVRHLEPDIIALQEVEGAHYHTHYLPWFTYLGYKCKYKKKTGAKVDGCLIAYNAKKFEVIEENSVEYCQVKGEKHLDRDNVGLIVKFTPISFYSPFCVATTHLLFNPKRHDVRLAQMTIFLTELDRICYIKEENNTPKYCPVILTGDFNSEPHTPLLKFIKYGSLNYSNTTRGSALIPSSLGVSEYCQHKSLSQGRYLQSLRGELFSLNDKRKIEEALIKISHSDRRNEITPRTTEKNYERDSGIINHGFKFKSVYYPNLLRLGGKKAVTTNQDRWVTVDYIFYSKVLKNQKCIEGDLKLIARYGLLGENEAEAVGPLPSDICPSDHFPLAAQFFLRRN
ncbi:UNVERIFIED_CONTAM: hypothetical protein RMT77_017205 [Armadillidium vulgare]